MAPRVCPWRGQPVGKVLFRVFGDAGDECAQPAADGQLVGKGEGRRAKKGRHVMKGRGQKGRLENAPPSARLDEGQAIEPADGIADAQAAVKIDEVDAVAQQHMLAVIDHLAGSRVFVRGGAAAKVAPLLQQADLVAGIGQGTRGRETCQSTANHSDDRKSSGPHSLRQRLEKAASQYAQLLIRRNANPRRKDIKVALFDVAQQTMVNGDQNPHRGPAVG